MQASGKFSTFADVKVDVFKSMAKSPLFKKIEVCCSFFLLQQFVKQVLMHTVQKPEHYGFQAITADAKMVDFEDEAVIARANLFRPVIKVCSWKMSCLIEPVSCEGG